ncbi:MAG: hypothetical protein WCG04_06660 [Alphaproteobacteria bacterium]
MNYAIKLKMCFVLIAGVLLSSAVMATEVDTPFRAGSAMAKVQLGIQRVRAAPDRGMRVDKALELLESLTPTKFRKAPATPREREVIINALLHAAVSLRVSVVDYIEDKIYLARNPVAITHYRMCLKYIKASVGAEDVDLKNRAEKIKKELEVTDTEYFLREQEKFRDVLGDNFAAVESTFNQVAMLDKEKGSILGHAQKAITDLSGELDITDGSNNKKYRVVNGKNYVLSVFQNGGTIIINGVVQPQGISYSETPTDHPIGAFYVKQLLYDFITQKQSDYGLNAHPVFEYLESIGLFKPEQKRDPLRYQAKILETVSGHLNGGVDALQQVRRWLANNPGDCLGDFYVGLRDFYDNAFTRNDEGECIPHRIDRLHNWISLHSDDSPKIEQYTITIYPNDEGQSTLVENIAVLVKFFMKKTKAEFLKLYPKYAMSSLGNIEKNAVFIEMCSRESFMTWYYVAVKKITVPPGFSLPDYVRLYSDRVAITSALDVMGLL